MRPLRTTSRLGVSFFEKSAARQGVVGEVSTSCIGSGLCWALLPPKERQQGFAVLFSLVKCRFAEFHGLLNFREAVLSDEIVNVAFVVEFTLPDSVECAGKFLSEFF